MARALRIEFEGAIYHVTARGNERRDIYRSEDDRRKFVELLAANVEGHHIRLYTYVLMSNHYHLVFETPRANLSAFMQQLNGAYTMYFNYRHQRSGHLFGGRYKAKLVEGDEYLLKLTRYVHLNPVKIRKFKKVPLDEKRKVLRGYRWSSYRGYGGLGRAEKWMDYGPLRELVGQGSGKKKLKYRQYVESGLAEDDEELKEAMGRSSKAIGLEGFCRWAEELYQGLKEKQGQPLDVAMRRMETPVPAERILEAVSERYGIEIEDLRKRRSVSDARQVAMKLLKEEGGLTQREVAVRLGLEDGSGVSRRLADLSDRLKKERKLRRTYESLRAQIAHNH